MLSHQDRHSRVVTTSRLIIPKTTWSMDNPLSDSDNNEVIADSEDERGQPGVRDKTSTSKDGPLRNSGMLQMTSATMPDGEIDYFAGVPDDMFLPVPSIAERAKMRQRKPKDLPQDHVLELTDDDELILKPPPSKSKKKTRAKEKPTKTPAETNQATNSNYIPVPPKVDFSNIPLINARTKIRPRPVKKPLVQHQSPQHNQTSQATIPVPSSPFRPLPNHFPDNSSRFDLPPSDPPRTSSLGHDKDAHFPPIEFLRPLEDTDTPLPSSLPGENVDELQIPNYHERPTDNHGATLPPPPATFFAGSSSLPNPPGVPTPQPPLPPPVIVDLTDIPSTAVAPSMGAPDPNTSTKVKKPRKPRKKKGETGGDELTAANAPHVTGRKKKGKEKANKVTVEVLLPLPAQEIDSAPVSKKHKGKKIQDDPMEEDELNIGIGQPGPSVETPTHGPSPSLEGSNQAAPDELDLFENPPKADKRKNKRKGAEGRGDASTATVSRKKKRASKLVEDQEDPFVEGSPVPPKKASKKAKVIGEGLGTDGTIEATQAAKVVKGKRRTIIASDDESDGGNAAPVVEDFPSPSPDPGENQKGKRESLSKGDATRAADHLEDDHNGLKHIKPTDDRSSSSPNGTTLVPQKRYETPSVGKHPSMSSRYTIAPKTQTSGISELIRRVSSKSNSPFPAPNGRGSPRLGGLAYSPYSKSSRRTLSRIAPLHPNRKTPPPPPPPPPPRKKSKKELELEEKWEEEIIEEVGGVTEWLNLSESEKKDLKRMKRDREMGYCED